MGLFVLLSVFSNSFRSLSGQRELEPSDLSRDWDEHRLASAGENAMYLGF